MRGVLTFFLILFFPPPLFLFLPTKLCPVLPTTFASSCLFLFLYCFKYCTLNTLVTPPGSGLFFSSFFHPWGLVYSLVVFLFTYVHIPAGSRAAGLSKYFSRSTSVCSGTYNDIYLSGVFVPHGLTRYLVQGSSPMSIVFHITRPGLVKGGDPSPPTSPVRPGSSAI